MLPDGMLYLLFLLLLAVFLVCAAFACLAVGVYTFFKKLK